MLCTTGEVFRTQQMETGNRSLLSSENIRLIFRSGRVHYFPPRKTTYSLYTTRPFLIQSLSAVTNIIWMTCLPVYNIFDLFDDIKILDIF